MTYEYYLKVKCWDNWPNIFSEFEVYFINSEPNEQCILGFEPRSVND